MDNQGPLGSEREDQNAWYSQVAIGFTKGVDTFQSAVMKSMNNFEPTDNRDNRNPKSGGQEEKEEREAWDDYASTKVPKSIIPNVKHAVSALTDVNSHEFSDKYSFNEPEKGIKVSRGRSKSRPRSKSQKNQTSSKSQKNQTSNSRGREQTKAQERNHSQTEPSRESAALTRGRSRIRGRSPPRPPRQPVPLVGGRSQARAGPPTKPSQDPHALARSQNRDRCQTKSSLQRKETPRARTYRDAHVREQFQSRGRSKSREGPQAIDGGHSDRAKPGKTQGLEFSRQERSISKSKNGTRGQIGSQKAEAKIGERKSKSKRSAPSDVSPAKSAKKQMRMFTRSTASDKKLDSSKQTNTLSGSSCQKTSEGIEVMKNENNFIAKQPKKSKRGGFFFYKPKVIKKKGEPEVKPKSPRNASKKILKKNSQAKHGLTQESAGLTSQQAVYVEASSFCPSEEGVEMVPFLASNGGGRLFMVNAGESPPEEPASMIQPDTPKIRMPFRRSQSPVKRAIENPTMAFQVPNLTGIDGSRNKSKQNTSKSQAMLTSERHTADGNHANERSAAQAQAVARSQRWREAPAAPTTEESTQTGRADLFYPAATTLTRERSNPHPSQAMLTSERHTADGNHANERSAAQLQAVARSKRWRGAPAAPPTEEPTQTQRTDLYYPAAAPLTKERSKPHPQNVERSDRYMSASFGDDASREPEQKDRYTAVKYVDEKEAKEMIEGFSAMQVRSSCRAAQIRDAQNLNAPPTYSDLDAASTWSSLTRLGSF